VHASGVETESVARHHREMSKSIALLFSGQGAQRVGMGKDLVQRYAVAANRFAQADAELGYSISQIAFEGPLEELTRTSNCQIALYVHGIAVLDLLREQLGDFEVKAAAGLSLGEFTAHAAVGTFDFVTGLRLVTNRSRYMEEACLATSGTMAACIGGDAGEVRKIADETGVDIANYNSPGQIVLSGKTENIRKAIELAKGTGVRKAVPLTVAGAFHSHLMQLAQDKLAKDLAVTAISVPKAPVVANVTARPVTDEHTIRETLAEQVTGSVRWTESVEYMIDELGCDLFLELGPGEVVAGLVSRIRKGSRTISMSDVASLEDGLARLRAGI
jgi:[acyl-carrier-protein] S-malonyltransferase